MEEASGNGRPKQAVVVVHGMGDQKPYETLNQLATGLRHAYPDSFIDWDHLSDFPIPDATLDGQIHTRIPAVRIYLDSSRSPERAIDAFEAYWADAADRKTSVISTLVWVGKAIGRLRWRAFHLLVARSGSGFPWGVVWACLIFAGAVVSMAAGFHAAWNYWVSSTGVADTPAIIYTILFGLLLFKALDFLRTHMADVQIYVGHRTDTPGQTYAVKQEITDRVTRAIAYVRAQGYENITVVAHSLGTVVAYNALMKVLEGVPVDEDPRIRNLVTLAAPFNKIHALFGLDQPRNGVRGAVVSGALATPSAQIAPGRATPGDPTVRWFNVTAAMESVGETIVVSVLKYYPAECFVVNNWNPLTTHNAYFDNPQLMAPLGRLIAGNANDLTIPWNPYDAAEKFYWALLPLLAIFLGSLPKLAESVTWTPVSVLVTLLAVGIFATWYFAGPLFLVLLAAYVTRLGITLLNGR